MHTLVFDVYGTLVDTTSIPAALETKLGERAVVFIKQWRNKQLEYAYRMGLMRWYQPFSQCARYAFEYTCEEFGVVFSEQEKEALFLCSLSFPAFDDAEDALKKLSQTDATCFAFSNGTVSEVETVLTATNIRPYFQDVISVDAVKVFKPSRIAYAYLLERIASYQEGRDRRARKVASVGSEEAKSVGVFQCSPQGCLHYVEAGLEEQENTVARQNSSASCEERTRVWLVSSNPFDVIGAKVAGLQAVWIKRSSASIYDPWGVEPTLTVATLTELYDVLRYRNVVTPT